MHDHTYIPLWLIYIRTSHRHNIHLNMLLLFLLKYTATACACLCMLASWRTDLAACELFIPYITFSIKIYTKCNGIKHIITGWIWNIIIEQMWWCDLDVKLMWVPLRSSMVKVLCSLSSLFDNLCSKKANTNCLYVIAPAIRCTCIIFHHIKIKHILASHWFSSTMHAGVYVKLSWDRIDHSDVLLIVPSQFKSSANNRWIRIWRSRASIVFALM